MKDQFDRFRSSFNLLREEIGKVFVGNDSLVENLLICLFCQGHVLLEGLPGLGKTLLVRTLSEALNLKFSRIQCTPDLMPADIIGTSVLRDGDGGREFRFERGPLFANVILADEINRATPKTQSAFLEAMQERQVTVFGTDYALDEPFFVLATQNPIELEGTYPLPEAQLDRFFFKLKIRMPSIPELARVMSLTTDNGGSRINRVLERAEIQRMSELVRQPVIAPRVQEFAIRVMRATHPDGEEAPPEVQKFVLYGASPRAAQSMILGGKIKAILDGRFNVSFEDILAVAQPSLEHRIILNFEGQVEKISSVDLVQGVLQQVEQ